MRSDLQLSAPRLPRLARPRRRSLDLERLQGLGAPVGFFFYLLMFVSVLATLAGASGTALLMLLVGAGLHVFRCSVEELAAQRRARADRKREVRLRSHRAARRVREATPEPQLEVTALAASPSARAQASPPVATRARKARVL